MSAQHTPGPWQIIPVVTLDDQEHTHIGNAVDSAAMIPAGWIASPEQKQANARLIAAAPDLLAAARAAVAALTQNALYPADAKAAVTWLSAAIEKAGQP